MPEVITSDASPSSALTGETRRDSLATPLSRNRVDPLGVSTAIVAGVAAVLGLIRLWTRSFWVDEGYTAYATHRSPEWWVDNDQYHVPYDSVARALVVARGHVRVRVAFSRPCPEPWRLVRCSSSLRAGSSTAAALLSGLFLATSPFLVKWSQQARGYTLLVALSLGATASPPARARSWHAWGLGRVWRFSLGHGCLARSGRAHAGAGASCAHRTEAWACVAPRWVGGGHYPRRRSAMGAATIAMRSTGAGVGMNWLTAPTPTTVARAVLDISGASGLGLLLAVVGLVVLFYARRGDVALWLGVWAFAPFVLALLPSAVRPIFLDRFLIVAAPAFALLAATAVTGVGR